MALVYIRPDADQTDGNWLNQSSSNTNLYDSLNETVASDSDYIKSGNFPANDIVKLRLSNFGLSVTRPMIVRYRFKKVVSAAASMSVRVRLLQASTTIAEWDHNDVSASYVTAAQPLSTEQFDLITDFDDLYLEFEAITGTIGGLGLLTDETEGFAIDATRINAPAFVGAPSVGSIAIIDTGTPANNLSNVAINARTSNIITDGTDPKMVRWGHAPYLRWTPHNLELESQTIDSGTWAKTTTTVTANNTTAPDGTSTADHCNQTSSVSSKIVQASLPVMPGEQQTTSFYAKMDTAPYIWTYLTDNGETVGVQAWFDVQNCVAGTATYAVAATWGTVTNNIENAGNGWCRCSITYNPGVTNVRHTIVGVDADESTFRNSLDYWIWGVQTNRGALALPYMATTTVPVYGVPVHYNTIDSRYGILSEPGSNNMLTDSERFPNWFQDNVSVTTNVLEAPHGETKADLITGNGTAAVAHEVEMNVVGSFVNNEGYTMSVWAKRGTNNFIQFVLGGGSEDAICNFDLLNGTAHPSAAIDSDPTATIEPWPNDWYRCSMTWFSDSTSTTAEIVLVTSTSAVRRQTNSLATSVYLWGAQIEHQEFMTSYIPTFDAVDSRTDDYVSAATAATPWQVGAGSIYIDWNPSGVNNQIVYPAQVTNGAETERIALYGPYFDGNFYMDVIDGGSPQASLDRGDITGRNLRQQAAVSFNTNDFDASLNGAASGGDASGTMPSPDTFSFCDPQNGGVCTLYRFVYVPRHVETNDGDLETWRYNFLS